MLLSVICNVLQAKCINFPKLLDDLLQRRIFINCVRTGLGKLAEGTNRRERLQLKWDSSLHTDEPPNSL